MRRSTASTSAPSSSPTGARTARCTCISASTAAWTRVRRSQRSSGLITAGPSQVQMTYLLAARVRGRTVRPVIWSLPPTRERPTYPERYAGQHPPAEARAPHPVDPRCGRRTDAEHQLRVLPAARRRGGGGAVGGDPADREGAPDLRVGDLRGRRHDPRPDHPGHRADRARDAADAAGPPDL